MHLGLMHRDLAGLADLLERPPRLPGTWARVGSSSITLFKQSRLLLEDLDLDARPEPWVDAWARLLASAWPEEEAAVWLERLVVVDDETMSYLLETGTQVDTRVRIDALTGTVAEGQLWQEESLPAETLLVGVLAAGRSLRKGTELSGEQVLTRALTGAELLQVGGKATVGRGRCRLAAWPPASKGARR
jgi:CRISPR-associated protein Cmr4